MNPADYLHVLDSLAGASALFLGYQVRQATRAIYRVVQNHEARLQRLEHRGKRRR